MYVYSYILYVSCIYAQLLYCFVMLELSILCWLHYTCVYIACIMFYPVGTYMRVCVYAYHLYVVLSCGKCQEVLLNILLWQAEYWKYKMCGLYVGMIYLCPAYRYVLYGRKKTSCERLIFVFYVVKWSIVDVEKSSSTAGKVCYVMVGCSSAGYYVDMFYLIKQKYCLHDVLCNG